MKVLATLALFMASCAMAVETLIFQDNFDTLDYGTWKHELTLNGGGNWEFQAYVNNRTTSFVEEGVLYLKPSYTEDYIGTAALTGGDWPNWGGAPADLCTSNSNYGCERNAAASGVYNNPIMSARLRTAESFSFTYGRVEFKAQLPKGDMIWPALWMLPTEQEYGMWPSSGEIDIMESRGSDASYCAAGGNNAFASTLHWGVNWDQNRWFYTHEEYTHMTSLADDFHIYGLYWDQDRLFTYIDNEANKVLDVDFTAQSFWDMGKFGAQNNPWRGEPNAAPFNREFHLIMNVAVGGTNGYFPDGDCGKVYQDADGHAPNTFWNAKNQWEPSWNPGTNDSAMKLDWVKVWSFDN